MRYESGESTESGCFVVRVKKLTEMVAAEVVGVHRDRLLDDGALPGQVLEALDSHGVLIFRTMHLDDDAQVRFCKRLAPVLAPEISIISLDPAKAPNAEYLKGTFDWHINGILPNGLDRPSRTT
jgi:alpha-ketoglutarate-dependent taurine dioxygenase